MVVLGAASVVQIDFVTCRGGWLRSSRMVCVLRETVMMMMFSKRYACQTVTNVIFHEAEPQRSLAVNRDMLAEIMNRGGRKVTLSGFTIVQQRKGWGSDSTELSLWIMNLPRYQHIASMRRLPELDMYLTRKLCVPNIPNPI